MHNFLPIYFITVVKKISNIDMFLTINDNHMKDFTLCNLASLKKTKKNELFETKYY